MGRLRSRLLSPEFSPRRHGVKEKAKGADAERQYRCLLKSEKKSSNYLAAINKALEVKLKRSHAKIGGSH